MSKPYEVTGFQSPCAEFAERPLSLDERYLKNLSSIFIIEAAGDSAFLGIKKNDKLIIDRSLNPKDKQLVLLVINNQFQLQLWNKNLLQNPDPDNGDFVWGVVTTLIREFK